MKNLAAYRKAVAALLGGGLFAMYVVLTDDVVTAQEWVVVAAGFLGLPLSVYGVPNDQP